MTDIRTEETVIYEKSRDLKALFQQMIKDYKMDLWKYCRYITGSPWDGEDLFQETMLKAFGGLYQRFHPGNPKAYLYRIATNTWIDQCRKKHRIIGSLEEEAVPSEDFSDRLDIEEALKVLTSRFSPRQAASFLLMEVFSFTAKETAGIVRTTPGAVYAGVRRMKQQLMENPPTNENDVRSNEVHQSNPVIQRYLKALNEADLEGVLDLLCDDVHYEAVLGFQEFSKEEIRSGSMQHGLPGFRAEERLLWNKPVIVVFFEDAIHDIQLQETENGKIVHHCSYYFRKEFLSAAAEELGLKFEMDKPAVDWD